MKRFRTALWRWMGAMTALPGAWRELLLSFLYRARLHLEMSCQSLIVAESVILELGQPLLSQGSSPISLMCFESIEVHHVSLRCSVSRRRVSYTSLDLRSQERAIHLSD